TELERVTAHGGVAHRARQGVDRHRRRGEVGVTGAEIDHIHAPLEQAALDGRDFRHRIAGQRGESPAETGHTVTPMGLRTSRHVCTGRVCDPGAWPQGWSTQMYPAPALAAPAALCRPLPPLPPSTALYRPFFPDPVPGEELLTSAPHVRPVPDHPSGPGQAVEDHGPIALGHHPPVEQHHSPHIGPAPDRKSTRLNSSHRTISYAVFCLKKKKNN